MTEYRFVDLSMLIFGEKTKKIDNVSSDLSLFSAFSLFYYNQPTIVEYSHTPFLQHLPIAHTHFQDNPTIFQLSLSRTR